MKADSSENFENTDEVMINGYNRHHTIYTSTYNEMDPP